MSSLIEILESWNKESKALVAVKGSEREELPRIPFSSATLNWQSYGGMPRRKVVEFFGPEGSGKTTTALDLVANAQYLFGHEFIEARESATEKLDEARTKKLSASTIRQLEANLDGMKAPKQVIYVDLENTLDFEWAEKLGVDIHNLWVIRPEQDSAEQILTYILELAKTGEVGLIILDSIPYLIPQQIMDESLEKKMYGGVAATLTEFTKKLTPIITKYNMLFLAINQIREDMSNPYSMYSTPGGKMWKHACSVRLKFKKGDYVDKDGKALTRAAVNPAGNMVECFVEKTKAFRPDRKLCTYQLSYYKGIEVAADLLDTAVQFQVINKGGAWYTFLDVDTGEILKDADDNDLKFNGRSAAVKALEDDTELYDMIMDQVHPLITQVPV